MAKSVALCALTVITLLATGCTAAPATRATPTVEGTGVEHVTPTERAASPGAAATAPPEWCTPADFPRASLPGVASPAQGERVTLQLDPCLTLKSLLGTYAWLEDQGIDAALIQGFESVAGIEPWIAPRTPGDGDCILLRADDRNGWREISCDSPGAPAAVERTVDGMTLRFSVEDAGIVVDIRP